MAEQTHDPTDSHNRATEALTEGNREVALEWSLRAAAGGSTSSMSNAGALLKEQGRLKEAEHWLRAGADSEYRELAGLPPDPGGYLVPRTGERSRSPTMLAQLNLGGLLEERGDVQEARAWFERAAASGHPDATWRAALFAHKQGDYENAINWCRLAAEAGNDRAQNTMGIEMDNAGDGDGARRWWRLAADNGNADAAKNLEVLDSE
jgi:TPR repeat protein